MREIFEVEVWLVTQKNSKAIVGYSISNVAVFPALDEDSGEALFLQQLLLSFSFTLFCPTGEQQPPPFYPTSWTNFVSTSPLNSTEFPVPSLWAGAADGYGAEKESGD